MSKKNKRRNDSSEKAKKPRKSEIKKSSKANKKSKAVTSLDDKKSSKGIKIRIKDPTKLPPEDAPVEEEGVEQVGSIQLTEEQAEAMISEINKLVEEQNTIPTSLVVNANSFDFRRLQEFYDRRLYLYGEILPPEEYGDLAYGMTVANIIESIMQINREDKDVPIEERKPIVLFINSPGGSVSDGFALISTIEASATPVYTVNVGMWCSMAFLIGITGVKRFSLPNMTFLLHDGTAFVAGSANKVQDRTRFDMRFEKEVVRPHVLKYTKITKKEYKRKSREEFYMLTKDALEYGVIDEIVTSLDTILF